MFNKYEYVTDPSKRIPLKKEVQKHSEFWFTSAGYNDMVK